MSYQLYRNTSLGQTLQDSLYELLQFGQIPPSLVSEVLVQYDRAVNEALANRVKTRVNFHSAKLDTYRFCDNVWTFLLKEVTFREHSREIVHVGNVKIVACEAKPQQKPESAAAAPGDDIDDPQPSGSVVKTAAKRKH